MSDLLFEQKDGLCRAALLEGGRLLDYLQWEDGAGLDAESLYLASAGLIQKGLKAAFMRLPHGEEGFLPFAEIPEGKIPRPGDVLMVQVKKPPIHGKKAYLSADITLAGHSLVLLLKSKALRLSRRVESEAERARLRALGERLKPGSYGIVLRQSALEETEEALKNELEELVLKADALLLGAKSLSAPCLLHQAPSPLEKLLRDESCPIEKALSNRPEVLHKLGLSEATFCAEPFALYRVEKLLFESRRRKILLPSGASLVLDPCEAALMVDVNSAKNTSTKQGLALKTNLEAAQHIASLLRLRRVGGMVLIDFIDMETEEERAQVLKALEDALKKDRVKSCVHGFTRLGLMEVTRKKAEEPLDAERLRPCPCCGGTGYEGLAPADSALEKPLKEESPDA